MIDQIHTIKISFRVKLTDEQRVDLLKRKEKKTLYYPYIEAFTILWNDIKREKEERAFATNYLHVLVTVFSSPGRSFSSIRSMNFVEHLTCNSIYIYIYIYTGHYMS